MAWLISFALLIALVLVAGLWFRTRAQLADTRTRLIEVSTDAASEGETSVAQLSAALDETSSAVVIVDADGEVVHRNSAAEPFADARHGDALIRQALNQRLEGALRGQTTEGSVKLAGPPPRTVSTSGRPLVVDGELIGAVAVVDDVSEHQRIADLRRDFVANVSHELKTPVGALSLLAETLAGETDPAVVSRFSVRMHDEAMRLDRLINDLLDLSRVEAGFEFQLETLDVREIVDEAAALVRTTAEKRDVVLDVDLGSEAPVEGDRSQLVSAVRNLFENGVKYTDAGGRVAGSITSGPDGVAVAVADTGRGIPQADLDRVFERFYRVDHGRSSDTGGTGLGLSIVRNVVTNHGGNVEVESQEGVGTTFTITLPASGETEAA